MVELLKSQNVTVVLALLPGLIGILGIGHFYVGRVRRGLILLFGAWITSGAAILCFVIGSMSLMVIPPPGYPPVETPAYSVIFFVAGIVLSLGLVVLWVWQIFDANTVCKDYNKRVSSATS